MIVTKTLSTSLSGGVYPATYIWSSDCDSSLTYSNKTGTVNNDGLLTTTISYDDIVCLQCNFYISINNNLGCYGNQDNKGVRAMSCGSFIFYANSFNYTVVFDGITYNVVADDTLTINNVFFGNHTLDISSPNLNYTSDANGITQVTNDGTVSYLNIPNNFLNPNITVFIS